MKRFLALGLCALTLTGVLSGCTPADIPAPTPTAAAPTPTATIPPQVFTLPCTSGQPVHPLNSTGAMDLALVGLLYEGLYALDSHFAPQPELCSGASVSEDNLTWTFSLRPGVTFSDRSPLTAEDAARSIRAAKESPLYAGRLAGVSSVTAGDGTVTISLSSPNGYLPALLDVPIFKEVEGVALGTGPYVWADGPALTARPGWWKGLPLPTPSIDLYPAADGEELGRAFDTGAITMLSVDYSDPALPGFSGNFETCDLATTTMLYLGFRCTGGPLADGSLRAALARSLDRQAVCSLLLARHSVASPLPIHPDSADFPAETAKQLAFSAAAADQALTELGYTPGEDGVLQRNGQRLAVSLLVNADNSIHSQVAAHIQTALADRGISVTLRALPWADYNAALAAGDFDLYLAATKLTADFDPTPLLAGSLNFGGYADETASGLLEQFRAARGSERPAAAQALYDHFVQAPPIAPICFKNESALTQWGQVEGLTPTRGNLFYGLSDWTLFPSPGNSAAESTPAP